MFLGYGPVLNKSHPFCLPGIRVLQLLEGRLEYTDGVGRFFHLSYMKKKVGRLIFFLFHLLHENIPQDGKFPKK